MGSTVLFLCTGMGDCCLWCFGRLWVLLIGEMYTEEVR